LKSKSLLSEFFHLVGDLIDGYAAETVTPVDGVAAAKAAIARVQAKAEAPAAIAPANVTTAPAPTAAKPVAQTRRTKAAKATKAAPRRGGGKADLSAYVDRFVGLLTAEGVRSEEARRVLSLDRHGFLEVVRQATQRNLIRVEGARRGTTYFRANAGTAPTATPTTTGTDTAAVGRVLRRGAPRVTNGLAVA